MHYVRFFYGRLLNTKIIPEFSLPSDIYARQNATASIAGIIETFGKRTAIIITSSDFEMLYKKIQNISGALTKAGIGCMIYDKLPKEPDTESIDEAVRFIKRANCDSIIGFGGIESINCAKAISILINNYVFCNDIFSQTLTNDPVNLVIIPAYPVFGFEINPFFYIADITENEKHVFFDRRLYPKATIIDPDLAMDVALDEIIKNGIATLAIALESIISNNNNEIINTFALKSIDMIFRSLPGISKETADYEKISLISTASFMAGIAFSSSFLSISAAIGLALTQKSKITFADAINVIIPYAMEYNLTAATGKYVQIAKVMGESLQNMTVIEAALKAVAAVRSLESESNTPQKLSIFNIQKQDIKKIAQTAAKYPFLENSPQSINSDEIEAIIVSAL